MQPGSSFGVPIHLHAFLGAKCWIEKGMGDMSNVAKKCMHFHSNTHEWTLMSYHHATISIMQPNKSTKINFSDDCSEVCSWVIAWYTLCSVSHHFQKPLAWHCFESVATLITFGCWVSLIVAQLWHELPLPTPCGQSALLFPLTIPKMVV